MKYLNRSMAAELADTHTIVGFGAGELGAKTAATLDGRISYFVDNTKAKQGQPWEVDLPVKAPSVLGEGAPQKTIVVICAEQFDAITEQIQSNWPGVDIYVSPLLKDFEVFDKLLHSSQRLLVSAYGVNGGIYLLNSESGEHKLLKKGSYRGFLPIENQLYVCTEHGEICRIDSLAPFKTTSLFKPEQMFQLHGMEFCPKRRVVYAAETAFDRIGIYSFPDFKRTGVIQIAKIVSDKPLDIHHVNDLFIEGDDLYCSVISVSGKWKQGALDGAVYRISLEDTSKRELILKDLRFPHSIRRLDGNIVALESMSGMFNFGDNARSFRLPGFVRGLEIVDGVSYVGQSRQRRIALAKSLSLGISMDSGVYVIHNQESLFRFIKLPEMCDVYGLIDLTSRDLGL